MDLLSNCSQCITVGDNDIQTASKWQLTSNSQEDAKSEAKNVIKYQSSSWPSASQTNFHHQ